MKEIPLTRGFVAVVDDEDFERVSSLKWYASNHKGRTIYAARHTSRKSEKHTVIYMHRFILNFPANAEVDHIDGNGLNNQKSNLRICSHQENMFHSRKRGKVSSQYKGVHWASFHKRWVAKIEFGGNIRTLGTFKEEKDAAVAYNKAAKELFGEFAILNIIEGVAA